MSNTEQENNNEEQDNILVKHNHIYFYTDVSPKSILELMKHLTTLEKQLLCMQVDYSLKEPPSIYLHIQSDGGVAYSGLSGMNMIQSMKVPVITIAEGFVASAATMLWLGSEKRDMQTDASILIHQIRGEFWGSYEDMKDDMKNSDQLMTKLLRIYTSKTTIPEKKLNKIIKRELHLDYDQCKKWKFITM